MRKSLVILTALFVLDSLTSATDAVKGSFTGQVVQSRSRDHTKWWANSNINPNPVNDAGGHISQSFRNAAGNPSGAVVWSPNLLNISNPGRYLVLRLNLVLDPANLVDSRVAMGLEYHSSAGGFSTLRTRWWYVTPNLGNQTIILDLSTPTIIETGLPPAPGAPLTQHFAFASHDAWPPTTLVQFRVSTGDWSAGSNDSGELAHAGNYCDIDLLAFVDDYLAYVPYGVTAYADFFSGLHQRESSTELGAWGLYPSSAPTVQYSGDLYLTADKKDILSKLYPLIGPYDTIDPAAAEYCILTAKCAGFSGFNCEWRRPWETDELGKPLPIETLTTRTIKALGSLASTLDFEIGLTWIPASSFRLESGYNFATREEYLDQVTSDIIYMYEAVFVDGPGPTINGRPLLTAWSMESRDAGDDPHRDWLDVVEIIDVREALIREGLPEPWILAVLRNGHTLDVGLEPAVDGFFCWHTLLADSMEVYPWDQFTTREDQVLFKSDFYRNCDIEWNDGRIRIFMGGASPRFDSHKALSWGNNLRLGFPDDDGLTLSQTLDTYYDSTEARLIFTSTWNDFAEATVVQPTREYGYRDVAILGDRLWDLKGWGDFDEALIRLPDRLFRVRRALKFLEQAGVSLSSPEFLGIQAAADEYASGEPMPAGRRAG